VTTRAMRLLPSTKRLCLGDAPQQRGGLGGKVHLCVVGGLLGARQRGLEAVPVAELVGHGRNGKALDLGVENKDLLEF
jgi:hypothetical protein